MVAESFTDFAAFCFPYRAFRYLQNLYFVHSQAGVPAKIRAAVRQCCRCKCFCRQCFCWKACRRTLQHKAVRRFAVFGRNISSLFACFVTSPPGEIGLLRNFLLKLSLAGHFLYAHTNTVGSRAFFMGAAVTSCNSCTC